jgi:hypothetical protein
MALLRILKSHGKALTVIPALLAVMVLLSPPLAASASTPLTRETLSGTGTTSNGSQYCTPVGNRSIGGNFSVSGRTGIGSPYPGTFTESGNFYDYGQRNPPFLVRFHASFTIISGPTKITGSLNAPLYTLGSRPCYGSLSFSSARITYSAVINGPSYSGTVAINASFTIGAGGTASLSESFS